jgi:hypothetical protein
MDSPDDWILPPEGSTRAPGCGVWGCIGGVGIVFALAIVALAGAAGWTSGLRTANANATATAGAEISDQLNRVPQDLANGNLQLADTRLRFLQQMTPGVEGVPDLVNTATAVYLDSLPTATPSPSPTPEAEATEAPFEVTAVNSGSQYDLAGMLQQARQAVAAGQFADAYDLLDVIAAVDANFERAEVRDLTAQALNGQARAMFNSNNPAQGIIWATRAEDMGVLQGELSFELFAAMKWRDAQAALGLSYPQAVNALQEILNLGPGRYYEQAQQLLFQQYVAFGDALMNDQNQGACPAIQQYSNALNIFNDGGAAAKRNSAQSLCAQATPTLGPGQTPGAPTSEPGQPPPAGQIAPVGQP